MAEFNDLAPSIQHNIDSIVRETVDFSVFTQEKEEIMKELRELATQAYLEGFSDH